MPDLRGKQMKLAVAKAIGGKPAVGYQKVVSRHTAINGSTVALNVRLNNRDTIDLRPFSAVSRNDLLRQDADGIWVKLRNMDGEVQISPAWRSRKSLRINGRAIPFTIKEIETKEEWEGYESLTRFHYRGRGGVGRRVPLIAVFNTWDIPRVAGFVELSSSMLVNVARKKILDAPFEDKELGIKWKQWDMKTAKKYNNALVRISRCVVYPELRGLGLAATLTNAAVDYARKRWHIGGLRPCFIEIIAEMLRYWPFVQKSGFVKVGETEGNNKRAPKAMAYLLKRKNDGLDYPQGGGGIMTMHRMHAEKLIEIQSRKGATVEEMVRLLELPSNKLDTEDWISLHDICRRKKPTYMRGLTPSACAHLEAHTYQYRRPTSRKQKRAEVLVSVKNLTVSARVQPEDTPNCRRIQEAFGIVSREFTAEIANNFSAEFKKGEVILIAGASGAGKSILLDSVVRIISGRPPDSNVILKGGQAVGKARVARLKTPPQNKSPIDLLADNGKRSLNEAMRLLARAGLAEAHLFARPSYALSVGQSYRLALALALSKNPDIVAIDEFCEPLDEYTAVAVCRKIRKMAKEQGICVLAATANAGRVVRELRPDRALLLSSGGRHNWLDGSKLRGLRP